MLITILCKSGTLTLRQYWLLSVCKFIIYLKFYQIRNCRVLIEKLPEDNIIKIYWSV